MPRILSYVHNPTTEQIAIVLLNNDALEAWATLQGDDAACQDQLQRAIAGWAAEYGVIARVIGDGASTISAGRAVTRFAPDAQDRAASRSALQARTVVPVEAQHKFPLAAAAPAEEDDHVAAILNEALALAYGARRGRV